VLASANIEQMSDPLTASDFWPLILKLPHEERVRLAKLALRAAASDDASAAAYAAAPPTTEEFSSRGTRLGSRRLGGVRCVAVKSAAEFE
jgi:hypothetical protein